VSKNATCGRGEETKKGQKLSYVKLAICPDNPRRRRPLKFCMRGRVLEVEIYFKFHENRSRGLRAVEGRNLPLPLTWPMEPYTTACTTVQAVSFSFISGFRHDFIICVDFIDITASNTASDDVTN